MTVKIWGKDEEKTVANSQGSGIIIIIEIKDRLELPMLILVKKWVNRFTNGDLIRRVVPIGKSS